MKKRNLGFTLIELVIVIAIIGILAAVLIPGYNYFMNKANKSNDEQLANSLTRIVKAYNIDNEPLLTLTEVRTLINEDIKPRGKNNHFWFNIISQEIVVSEDVPVLSTEPSNTKKANAAEYVSYSSKFPEGFACTTTSPFVLLDTGGSILADTINLFYKVSDLETMELVKESISKITNENEKTALNTIFNKTIFVIENEVLNKNEISNNAIFTKDITTIPSEALANVRVEKIVLPNTILKIGNNAFANTGITNILVPTTVTSIGDGAFSSNLNINVTIENSNATLGTSFVDANSTVIISNKAYKASPTKLVNISNDSDVIDLSPVSEYTKNKLASFASKISSISETKDYELLDFDNYNLVLDYKNQYELWQTWEKEIFSLDYHTTEYNKFFNTTLVNFNKYLENSNLVYQTIIDNLINDPIATDASTTNYLEIKNKLTDLVNNVVGFDQSININTIFGYIIDDETIISVDNDNLSFDFDNVGIANLSLVLKGNLNEDNSDFNKIDFKLYSKGLKENRIDSEMISNNELANMQVFGNEGEILFLYEIGYITENISDYTNNINVTFKITDNEENEITPVTSTEKALTTEGVINDSSSYYYFFDELTEKYYVVKSISITDTTKDYYKITFSVSYKNSNSISSELYFRVVEAINVQTFEALVSNGSKKNIAINNKLTLENFEGEGKIVIEDGSIMNHSNYALACTGFTVSKTLYGNNYCINATNYDTAKSESDMKFMIVSNAVIDNVYIKLEHATYYDNNGYDNSYSASAAALRVGGSANTIIRNSHIEGGLRGIRTVLSAGNTLTIENTLFEANMSSVEFYAGDGTPKSPYYVNLINVSFKMGTKWGNDGNKDTVSHGNPMVFFPGNRGKGTSYFGNIYVYERGTKIYNWLELDEAKSAAVGMIRGVMEVNPNTVPDSLIENALFSYMDKSYANLGLLVPTSVTPGSSTYTIDKNSLKINSTLFTRSAEVEVLAAKLIGYYASPNAGEDKVDFYEYLGQTWGYEYFNSADDFKLLSYEESLMSTYQHHGSYLEQQETDYVAFAKGIWA